MDDEAEFARTVAPLSRDLFTYCVLMAGSVARAGEFLDEVYARARRSFADPGAGPAVRERPRMWLYGIARDVCFERLGDDDRP
jgi:DNA-directed RNA polymerase specialized sigma24 family protein